MLELIVIFFRTFCSKTDLFRSIFGFRKSRTKLGLFRCIGPNLDKNRSSDTFGSTVFVSVYPHSPGPVILGGMYLLGLIERLISTNFSPLRVWSRLLRIDYFKVRPMCLIWPWWSFVCRVI